MKRTHGEQGVGIGFQPAASRPTKTWDAPPDVDRMPHASVFSPELERRRNRMRAGGRCDRLAVRDKGSTGGSIDDALDQLPAIFRHVRDTAPRDARIMASF